MILFLSLFLFLTLSLGASKTIAILVLEGKSLSSEQVKIGQLLKVDSVLIASFRQTENTKVEYHKDWKGFSSLVIPLIESLVTKITQLLFPPFSEENIPATGINGAYFVLNHTLLFPMKL